MTHQSTAAKAKDHKEEEGARQVTVQTSRMYIDGRHELINTLLIIQCPSSDNGLQQREPIIFTNAFLFLILLLPHLMHDRNPSSDKGMV